MSEMTMPKMAVAMTMAVTMTMTTVMAVTAMPAVAMTTGEGLTRDGERGGGQRQSRDSGRNCALDPAHERLLVVQREDRSAMIQPRGAECDTM
jgi:hypothetical protein